FRINSNQFEGPVPQFLVNCKDLEILDLGHNNFNDTFPVWLGNSNNLQILVLRSNRFHGQIINSEVASSFSHLRIIDISHNDFSGCLPSKFFEGLLAISNGYEKTSEPRYIGYEYSSNIVYYVDSFFITIKGLELEVRRIIIFYLMAINFSNNQFNGQIPKIIGKLQSLTALNLSHNSLTGAIPTSLGNLSELELLDLSSNRLEGKIPAQLINLVFLEGLNFSWNNLMGPIPQENQFSTFSNDSYIGNSGLCGLPLSKICDNDEGLEPPPAISDGDDDITRAFDWRFATLIGYGCGLVIDFSNNRFSGQISETIGRLQSLRALNLSHNSLTGPIPLLLGNLTSLESLNLSSNKLEGRIPAQLANLSFLEVLNLSWNNLMGLIPRGAQFDTYDKYSYIGNLGLCGLPLSKICDNDDGLEPPSAISDGDDDIKRAFNWRFATLIGYGSGLVFGFFMEYLDLSHNRLTRPIEQILKPNSIHDFIWQILTYMVKYQLRDTFPHRLGVLPQLQVLILGFNRFHGPLDNSIVTPSFQSLQIIDLSQNEFSGLLPTNFFQNLHAMKFTREGNLADILTRIRYESPIDRDGQTSVNVRSKG
ncbi:Leucine-rich repeat - like 10, partial [Theobroma cacao]